MMVTEENQDSISAFLLPATSWPMPVTIAASGAFFNLVNGSLNGLWLFILSPARPTSWLSCKRRPIGARRSWTTASWNSANKSLCADATATAAATAGETPALLSLSVTKDPARGRFLASHHSYLEPWSACR